jgi:cation channel sperm-associated protein 1
MDTIFLGIYIFELSLKIYAQRREFIQSGWNWFGTLLTDQQTITGSDMISDLVIVLLSFLDWIQFAVQSASLNFDPRQLRLLRVLRAFRALRALRALRAITFLKKLQIVVSALLRSLPAMGSTMLLLFLVLCIHRRDSQSQIPLCPRVSP